MPQLGEDQRALLERDITTTDCLEALRDIADGRALHPNDQHGQKEGAFQTRVPVPTAGTPEKEAQRQAWEPIGLIQWDKEKVFDKITRHYLATHQLGETSVRQ